jgi:hypothetical protein
MNNNYNFQFIEMLIYLPIICLLLTWLYLFKLNVFLSVLLTPVAYIAINGALIMYKQFSIVHETGESIFIIRFTENQLKFIMGKISEIGVIKKLYLLLKVKILVTLFNIIINYIPQPKTNELTMDLKNDYLDILRKNRNRASSPARIN